MNKYIIQFALLIGVVDQVYGNYVTAEVTTTEGIIEYIQMHKDMIPCAVAEGDMFYFEKENEVVEIRCGEPPV
jgi:hypothetical protein